MLNSCAARLAAAPYVVVTTAILTITCPHCGGRIENVRSTDVEQTLPCPFCRTDLHIPRVGTERVVIHEVIREVSQPVVRRSRLSVLSQLIIGLFAFIALFIAVAVSECRSNESIVKRTACVSSCEDQCANAGDNEPPDRDGEGLHDLLAKNDVSICKSRCEDQAKCWNQ